MDTNKRSSTCAIVTGYKNVDCEMLTKDILRSTVSKVFWKINNEERCDFWKWYANTGQHLIQYIKVSKNYQIMLTYFQIAPLISR